MLFFLITLGVGLVFLVVVAVFGGLLDMGHDAAAPHVDLGSGADVAHGAPGLSPLSPTIIAFFLTVFGAVGVLCMSMFDMKFSHSLLVALLLALGSATTVYFALAYVFERSQGGVEVNVAQLGGREAEVITAIPKNGTGEIAFITSGGRTNGPARSADGEPITLNTTVEIVKMIGNAYIVKRKT